MSGLGSLPLGSGPLGSGEGLGPGPFVLEVPGVARVVPASGSTLERDGSIEFEVVDNDPGIVFLAVWVRYQSSVESLVVWTTSAGFTPGFAERSSLVQPCPQNNRLFQFSIAPTAIWTDDISALTIRAMDGDGNLVVDSFFVDVACP